MINCVHCGQANTEGARFCKVCGKGLSLAIMPDIAERGGSLEKELKELQAVLEIRVDEFKRSKRDVEKMAVIVNGFAEQLATIEKRLSEQTKSNESRLTSMHGQLLAQVQSKAAKLEHDHSKELASANVLLEKIKKRFNSMLEEFEENFKEEAARYRQERQDISGQALRELNDKSKELAHKLSDIEQRISLLREDSLRNAENISQQVKKEISSKISQIEKASSRSLLRAQMIEKSAKERVESMLDGLQERFENIATEMQDKRDERVLQITDSVKRQIEGMLKEHQKSRKDIAAQHREAMRTVKALMQESEKQRSAMESELDQKQKDLDLMQKMIKERFESEMEEYSHRISNMLSTLQIESNERLAEMTRASREASTKFYREFEQKVSTVIDEKNIMVRKLFEKNVNETNDMLKSDYMNAQKELLEMFAILKADVRSSVDLVEKKLYSFEQNKDLAISQELKKYFEVYVKEMVFEMFKEAWKVKEEKMVAGVDARLKKAEFKTEKSANAARNISMEVEGMVKRAVDGRMKEVLSEKAQADMKKIEKLIEKHFEEVRGHVKTHVQKHVDKVLEKEFKSLGV